MKKEIFIFIFFIFDTLQKRYDFKIAIARSCRFASLNDRINFLLDFYCQKCTNSNKIRHRTDCMHLNSNLIAHSLTLNIGVCRETVLSCFFPSFQLSIFFSRLSTQFFELKKEKKTLMALKIVTFFCQIKEKKK